MAKDPLFLRAKESVIENLETIQLSLIRCVEEGMLDADDAYYNELLALLEDARIVATWDELMEVVALAKTLEIDVAVWMSRRGKTTISLPWPKK